MPNNTLTIALNGEVSLPDFVKSFQNFQELVTALSDEVGSGALIEWVIDDLEAGSAVATIRGLSEQTGVVEKVVLAYGRVGRALEMGQPIPYSARVQTTALALTRVIDGHINSIRFETEAGAATVATRAAGQTAGPSLFYALGVLKGVVESLTKRHRLRFTMYDPIFDRAVNCYLKAGQEEEMRNIWGKLVVVSGRIGRDAQHGYPLEVREIRTITVVSESLRGSYKLARGVAPVDEGAESAEAVIGDSGMPRDPELIYWDSNVFLSYVNGDPVRLPIIDAVLAAVAESEGEQLIVTATISKVEVAYTAGERSRRALDEEVATQIDQLWGDDSVIATVELSDPIVAEARRLMRLAVVSGWKLRPMDAIHLATAKWLKVKAFHTYDLADLQKFADEVGCAVTEPFVPQPKLPSF